MMAAQDCTGLKKVLPYLFVLYGFLKVWSIQYTIHELEIGRFPLFWFWLFCGPEQIDVIFRMFKAIVF